MGVLTTVVFTDLIGSTTAFEMLGNAKATQAVTGINRWICDFFEMHRGRVIKTLGDGVLAVFPDGHSAVQSVVELQRAYRQRSLQLSAPERMPIRVGVATGEVEIVDGDCYGDAVNVASRLNDLCGPHEIWVDSSVLDRSVPTDQMRYRLLGPISVRGRAEPCMVYQVEWQDDEPSELLTRLADLDITGDSVKADVLGAEIELTLLEQKRRFKSFDLPIHIGRFIQSDFLVNDPRVSRIHARVEWRNGSIVLVDLSSYGTSVRFAGSGAEVLLRREECILHGRGEIALGGSFVDPTVPAIQFSVI